MAKITVLGSGGWGLALAITLFTNGHEVKVWSPFKEEVEQLRTKRTNEKLLKGIYISDKIEAIFLLAVERLRAVIEPSSFM